jgi:hypothetical protein
MINYLKQEIKAKLNSTPIFPKMMPNNNIGDKIVRILRLKSASSAAHNLFGYSN